MAHDVLVLGATVAGLTVARRLAHRGFDVLVLDPNGEGESAAIGHGVAAVGHASTIANMAHAYGLEAAREHVRRNLAGIEEIREISPAHDEVTLRDLSLPGGDETESRRIVELYREAGHGADLRVSPDGVAIHTAAFAVDPTAYAHALRAAAVAAGAHVVQGVTVVRLTRREGATRVHFRNNLAEVRDVGTVSGAAVVDTLGVSPWGRAALVGPAQSVPVVRCVPSRPLREVTLRAASTAWLMRPVGDRALVLGQKTTPERVGDAAGELRRWCEERLGATDVELGRLAIDPSDHGRPVVGASAIPGGYYARGNGRGELMNGTASGWYLTELMADGPGTTLPPISRLRAMMSRSISRA
ncbi:MAG: FAD-dependent oxidoreductase [Arachnia sp.]